MPPERIKLSVNNEDVHCVCIKGEAASNNGAILLLSDIFGADTDDTHAVAAKFADTVQSTVYIPDIFKGNPWPRDKEAGATTLASCPPECLPCVFPSLHECRRGHVQLTTGMSSTDTNVSDRLS